MELDSSRRAFGCNPIEVTPYKHYITLHLHYIEVTLQTVHQAQKVLSHEAFFRVGTICSICHYANMKLEADIKI